MTQGWRWCGCTTWPRPSQAARLVGAAADRRRRRPGDGGAGVKGSWAAGIAPRNFTWIIRDRLAVSERPGGFAPNHRRVRRQEEIIWLQVQGFDRVVSLLPSPHNLARLRRGGDRLGPLPAPTGRRPPGRPGRLLRDLDRSLSEGLRVLVHQDELGDRVMGVVAGYLVWSARLPTGPQVDRPGGARGRPPDGLDRAGAGGGGRRDAAPPGRVTDRPGSGPVAGDRIEVRGLRVVAVHGVLPEERDGPSRSRSTSTCGSTLGGRRRPTTWATPSTTAP